MSDVNQAAELENAQQTVSDLRAALTDAQRREESLQETATQAANFAQQAVERQQELQHELLQAHAQHKQLETELGTLRKHVLRMQLLEQDLAAREHNIKTLNADLERARRMTAEAVGALAQTKKTLAQLEAQEKAQHQVQHQQDAERLHVLEEQLRKQSALAAAREDEANQLRVLLAAQDGHAHRVDALQAELQQTHHRLRELESAALALHERDAELARLRAHLGQTETALRAAGARDALLELAQTQLETGAKERAKEKTELQAKLQAAQLSLAQKDDVIGELRVQLSAKPAPRQQLQRPARDDLTLIPGIGPALQRVLNKQGVRRFEQIARWSKDDIARIDAGLRGFHGRIVRDQWVRGAKRWHQKIYGEKI